MPRGQSDDLEQRLFDVYQTMQHKHDECMSSVWTLLDELTSLKVKVEALRTALRRRRTASRRRARKSRR